MFKNASLVKMDCTKCGQKTQVMMMGGGMEHTLLLSGMSCSCCGGNLIHREYAPLNKVFAVDTKNLEFIAFQNATTYAQMVSAYITQKKLKLGLFARLRLFFKLVRTYGFRPKHYEKMSMSEFITFFGHTTSQTSL